jgi:hypothetical protein
VTWTVEFFEDDQGRQPVREWLQSLDALKRASAIAAIEVVLTDLGLNVCGTEYGKQLGSGLFEFRIRHDEAVIRGKTGAESDCASSASALRPSDAPERSSSSMHAVLTNVYHCADDDGI